MSFQSFSAPYHKQPSINNHKKGTITLGKLRITTEINKKSRRIPDKNIG
jgi:hypothetical protein